MSYLQMGGSVGIARGLTASLKFYRARRTSPPQSLNCRNLL